MTRTTHRLLALTVVAVCLASLPSPADAQSGRPTVTSLHTAVWGFFVPLYPPNPCDAEPVELTGQLHVVSRVRMSNTGLTGDVYLNLHGVEGVSTSGQRYLGIGAAQVPIHPPEPGRPLNVDFTLRSVGLPPSPCTPEDQALPLSISLTFDPDGTGALSGAEVRVGRIVIGQ